ncbi:DNA polymerase III subunit delta' [Hydrogenimonas thermophila]|nr:DNA polymerase III subunit delta' [Hydrogenimonas thermophila]
MSTMTSQIIITDRFDEVYENLKVDFPEHLFYRIDADEFLVEHAKECQQKAYLTSDKEKVIVLTANRFTPIAQNKLLKVFEEPPSKTYFILMTPLKSGLLATIRSRLPIVEKEIGKEQIELSIDLEQLDLSQLFDFLQSNRRIDAKKAQVIVETLAKEVMKNSNYRIDNELLEAFSQSIRLLDMGSPVNFVLTRLCLKLLERKRK